MSLNNPISYKVEWLPDGNVQVLTKQNTCFLFLQLSMEDGKLQNISWTSTFQYLNLTTTHFKWKLFFTSFQCFRWFHLKNLYCNGFIFEYLLLNYPFILTRNNVLRNVPSALSSMLQLKSQCRGLATFYAMQHIFSN